MVLTPLKCAIFTEIFFYCSEMITGIMEHQLKLSESLQKFSMLLKKFEISKIRIVPITYIFIVLQFTNLSIFSPLCLQPQLQNLFQIAKTMNITVQVTTYVLFYATVYQNVQIFQKRSLALIVLKMDFDVMIPNFGSNHLLP